MSAPGPTGSLLQRTLARACDIRPEETRTTLASFLLVLVLMGSYYILRPVRDAMASDWTDAEVSWLWTFTFIFSAIAVSLYGGAVTRIRVQRLVPSVYGFFATSFILAALREFRFHREIGRLKKQVETRDKEIGDLRTLPLREGSPVAPGHPAAEENSGD